MLVLISTHPHIYLLHLPHSLYSNGSNFPSVSSLKISCALASEHIVLFSRNTCFLFPTFAFLTLSLYIISSRKPSLIPTPPIKYFPIRTFTILYYNCVLCVYIPHLTISSLKAGIIHDLWVVTSQHITICIQWAHIKNLLINK